MLHFCMSKTHGLIEIYGDETERNTHFDYNKYVVC